MPTNPKADETVEIVGAGGQADYKVQVVGDQVVDLTGATPGDVLVVQADGTLAPVAAVAGGAVDSVTAASAKIVVAGTATNPTVDVGTGIPAASITGLGTMATQAASAVAISGGTVVGITDLAVADGGTGSSTAADARTALGLGTAAVSATGDFEATAGHTSNSVPAASGSTTLADLAMGASTILARLAAGNIVAATPDQLKTLLAIAQGDVSGLTAALALLATIANPTFTGVATAPSVSASGKTGATNQATILAGGTASGAPSTGAHVVGELVVDATGAAWYCTVAGTPGTWVAVVKIGPTSQLIIPQVSFASASVGTWVLGNWSGEGVTYPFGNTGYQCTSGLQNDTISYPIVTAAGTWSIALQMRKSTNVGIATIKIDGVSVGTLDGYNAAVAYATPALTGVAISEGAHTLQIIMATKNASSTAYGMNLFAVAMIKTA